MPEAIAFDTHRFVKRLTDSGFTERQAETLAEEHVALINANLASKADVAEIVAGSDALRQEAKADVAQIMAEIEALRQETKAVVAQIMAEIEALRQETKADIAKVEARIEEAKSEILKWVFGALVAQGGLIVALVKLL